MTNLTLAPYTDTGTCFIYALRRRRVVIKRMLYRMSEMEVIEYLQKKSLVHRERKCKQGHQMKLKEGRRGRCPAWRCQAGGCDEEISVRRGTWFEGPRW
uniref:Uncharacterized protein n=1 Tax=Trichuris muris TaxID=70415 RepID=A0A5S6R5Z5_TRIMR